MASDATKLNSEVEQGLVRLGSELPRTMAGFGRLHQAAMADGELPAATKELIALAISVTEHCSGCVAYHTTRAVSAGATGEHVKEAVGVAIVMGGGPAAVYGAEALQCLETATS